jgi:F-type H+-transporting ATPase subunit O
MAVRSFSAEVSHVPPKKVHGTVGKYAGALYTAASKASLLPKVEVEIAAFSAVMKKNEGFASFFKDPTISRGDKERMVDSLTEGKKFSYITQNLLVTMAANGRIGDAGKVADTFIELMEASRGSVKATIISAEALKKGQAKDIEAAVMNMIGKGKKVDLTFKEDSNILGGLQVVLDDKVLDLSIAARVTDLNMVLEGGSE